jgi:hypothetical protein
MTQQEFLIKTKGWLLTHGTIESIRNTASWYAWTADGRFAWAEQQKIELTGLAKRKVVPIPQGWAVQEMVPPRGFCFGLYQQEYTESVKPNSLPWNCEIHDFWTTRKLTGDELRTIAGEAINQRSGPAMEGYAFTVASAANAQPPFMDWEQIVAARSRTWAPTQSIQYVGGAEGLLADVAVRKTFVAKLHDNQWGSMEPIACLDLYHCRLMISNMDTESPETIEVETAPFCDIPPSLQPMIVDVVKPNFITRMTYERRSKGI